MSKGDKDIIFVKAHALASDGAGVAHSGSLVVFVRGLLPGETARVLVTERRKKFWRGELLELVPPQPNSESHDSESHEEPDERPEFPEQGERGSRRLPTCPVFGRCGGCDLQHMSYEATLSWKKQWVLDAMARIAKVKVPVNDVAGLKEPWRYRNKATLHWDGMSLGWYAAQTHEVVEFADCLLLSQGMNETVMRLKSSLAAWSAAPMSITLRQDTAGKVWLVNGDGMGQEILDQIDQGAEGTGSGEVSNTALAGDAEEHLTYQVNGLSIIVSPGAFFQVNSEQVDTLLETVTEMADLKGRETIWDLYCGVGVLGLGLARHARAVVGIEENPQAIRDAYLNARLNGIGNICFIAGKTEDILDSDLTCQENRLEIVKVPPDFITQAASVQPPDLVVVDPPRAGLDNCVLERISQLRPEKILYVSCDPSTLARDVGRLVHGGGKKSNSSKKKLYAVRDIQPIDMFPWTRHVETVVLLSRKENCG